MYGRRPGPAAQIRRHDPFDQVVSRGLTWPLRPIRRSPPLPDRSGKSGTLTVDDILDDRVVVQKRQGRGRSGDGSRRRGDVVKIIRRRRRQREELHQTASYRLLELLKGKNSRICDGRTCFGIWRSDHNDAVDDAIAEGADLEHTDADGNFPLAVVLHYRHAAAIVERLLSAGAEAQRPFRDGSLLDLVLGMVHARPYISVLLQRGVKPRRSPSVTEPKLMVIARLYDVEEQARALLEQLLFEAVEFDDVQLLKCVFAHGIKTEDLQRRDLLHYAIFISASVQVVELLLQKGSDPNRVDEERHCPLQIAVLKQRSLAIVNLLLRYGADPSKRIASYDEDGQVRLITVAEFAADNGISQDSINAISRVYRESKCCDK